MDRAREWSAPILLLVACDVSIPPQEDTGSTSTTGTEDSGLGSGDSTRDDSDIDSAFEDHSGSSTGSSTGIENTTSSGSNAESSSGSAPDTGDHESSGSTTDTGDDGSSGDPPIDPTLPCRPGSELNVATFNIRFDDGESRIDTNAWNRFFTPRRTMAIETIESIDPDILGVQEALVNQVEDLVDAFPNYTFVGVGRNDGVESGEYAGIFVRTIRFELVDFGYFWLSETPEIPGTVFPESQPGPPRMATWVTLYDHVTALEFFVLNTHWDNVSSASRRRSAELIREQIETLAQARPVIMTGDLNGFESSTEVQTLLDTDATIGPALIDGYREINPMSPQEATFHGFQGQTDGQRIDYVLHDDAFSTTTAIIHTDDFNGRYPSDHFPVNGVLVWTRDRNGDLCAMSLR